MRKTFAVAGSRISLGGGWWESWAFAELPYRRGSRTVIPKKEDCDLNRHPNAPRIEMGKGFCGQIS